MCVCEDPEDPGEGEGGAMGSLGKAVYYMGHWIRGAGQALDRVGSALQGRYAFQEHS